MILAHAHPKTGHPNCRRPDKVIDAGQQYVGNFKVCKNAVSPKVWLMTMKHMKKPFISNRGLNKCWKISIF